MVHKYINSLYKIGLDKKEADIIVNNTMPRLYNKISTRKLYGITFNEIKKLSPKNASIYSLKESLRLLGPSGFPFEHLMSELFKLQGYTILRDQYIKGKCTTHEIDIIATKLVDSSPLIKEKSTLIEVKFHVEFGHKSDIKIPLYVKARFDDIRDANGYTIDNYTIITNTKFTINAINYSACANVNLIAWSYPSNNSVEMLIDRYRLYPVTVLHCLTAQEKLNFINNNILTYDDLGDAQKKALISDSKLEEIFREYESLRG